MADIQRKKNTYAILFFLAILFVAIGFEHNGALSGLAVKKQSATFPETLYIDCSRVTGSDLADQLVNSLHCSKRLSEYCANLNIGKQLTERALTLQVSCSSSMALQRLRKDCQQAITTLCSSPNVRTINRR